MKYTFGDIWWLVMWVDLTPISWPAYSLKNIPLSSSLTQDPFYLFGIAIHSPLFSVKIGWEGGEAGLLLA